MKHNWTYKKLNEVCEKASSNIALNKIENNIGEYPLYGASGLVKHIDFYHKDKPYIGIIKDGAGVGRVGKYPAKSSLVGTMQYIHPNEEICHIDYLYFALQSLHLNESVTGATIPHIYFKDYGKLSIPIPSLDEQQAIVRELDGINRLIDLQEEQLREYDRLAQSLFYTTFGEEEKWQKATLKDICSSIIRGPFGSALKKDFFVPKSSDTYKVYEQKHAIQKNATIGAYYITKEKFEELKRFEVFPEDIIMSCSGTIGELFVIPLDAEKGVMNQALLKFHLNELATIPYFLFVMEYVKSKMTVQGCGLQNIGSVKEICKIDFPLPPLALQQTFASQVEAIEQQKALIRKSLEDTRTLLAARMQYYFE